MSRIVCLSCLALALVAGSSTFAERAGHVLLHVQQTCQAGDDAKRKTPPTLGDSDTLRPLGERVKELEREVAMLKLELAALKKQVADLRTSLGWREDSDTRKDAKSEPVERRHGAVRLVNRLCVTARVLIDGVEYEVRPRSERTVRNWPAGTIRYRTTASGWGLSAPKTTRVRPGETLTLTIHE